MKAETSIKNYSLFSALFTAAGLLAVLWPTLFWLRFGLAAIYFLGGGYLAARLFMPKEKPAWQLLFGFLAQMASVMIIGGAIYYLYRLDMVATLAVTALAPTILQLLALLGQRLDSKQPIRFGALPPDDDETAETRGPLGVIGLLCALGFAGLAIYGLRLLDGAATELAIRSPWDDVPRLFFIIIFMLAAAGFGLAIGRLAGAVTLAPLAGLAVLATTVAAAIYSVGFGFDPFIHQATESHIFNFGAMTPKTPYYVGQYALVTVLARMVGGFVTTIDIWLVPLSFALILPVAYWSLRRSFSWPPSVAAAATAPLLLLPLSSFIVTTPQSLANLLLLITVFVLLASITSGRAPKWLAGWLAAAATIVHPLAGAPLLLFVAMASYLNASHSLRRMPEVRWTFFVKLAVLTSVALPLMFIVNSRLSGTDVTLDQEALRTPAAILEELKNPELETRRFSAALDFVYFWRANRTIVLSGLIILGAILLWWTGRRRENERLKEAAISFAVGGLAFTVNFILLRTWVKFPFLIDYERTNYADRMAELALFIAVPLALFAFGQLILHLRRRGFPSVAVGLTLLLAALIAANIYIAYPRRDNYETSRGWSTSAADIKAVQSIDNDSGDQDYVVLANQSVAAAAIRELGFKKYYQLNKEDEPIFFYPIPTGGQLYQVFLDTNEQLGEKNTALAAAELTGVSTVYFIVNHYWWQAQQVVIEAKREADDWWEIDNRIWVFKYRQN